MSVRGAADPQRRRCGGRGRWRRGAAALGGPPRPHPHPAPLPPGSAVPPPGGRRHCTAPVRPAPRGDAPTPRRCRSITPVPSRHSYAITEVRIPSRTRSAPSDVPLDQRSARSAVEMGEAVPEGGPPERCSGSRFPPRRSGAARCGRTVPPSATGWERRGRRGEEGRG